VILYSDCIARLHACGDMLHMGYRLRCEAVFMNKKIVPRSWLRLVKGYIQF
jgi:hypothetical protein